MLVAGLVSAVAIDGDDDAKVLRSTGAAGGSSTTAAEATDSTAAGSPDASGASTTAPGSTPSTGAAGKAPAAATPVPTTVAATGDPGRAQPTKVGTYTYDNTIDGSTSEGTMTVEAKAGSADETRQTQTLKGEQGSLKNEVFWRADGVYLASSAGSNGGIGGECNWEPDLLTLRLPVAKGTSWTADSACSGTSPYGPYSLKAHFEGTVRGTARVAVGDQHVDVWVIDGKQHVEINSTYQGQPIKLVQDSTSTAFFAPTRGLVVREESTAESSGPQGSRTQTTVRQLKDFTPH